MCYGVQKVTSAVILTFLKLVSSHIILLYAYITSVKDSEQFIFFENIITFQGTCNC